MLRRVLLALSIVAGLWVLTTVVLQLVARPAPTQMQLQPGNGERLVVVVHGMAGRDVVQPLFELVRQTFGDADVLDVSYDATPLSNADPYDIANSIEARIHAEHTRAAYRSIVLVGHSMGAMVVRKVILWGNGQETDRPAAKGARAWVERVDRVVSLASINRGWSIEPKPEKMRPGRYVSMWLGERVGRATGTGALALSMRRGAPFIADSRVQWIRLARTKSLPQVVHLLGSHDDLVSREDATDLGVARGTVFVTLADTDHVTIATRLSGSDNAAVQRRDAVQAALLGDLRRLSPDHTQELKEVSGVRRVVFAVHGIRDRGEWARDVRAAIEARARPTEGASPSVVVNDTRYGYFAMLPFLLYADRQAHVRKFMDEYTEALARFPDATAVDYVGHSNGTYLLASALQHYRTMKVDRVYFAGSVVPTHYPWGALLDEGRVARVVNVVADGDWVVALFPMLFEQIAVWAKSQPVTGFLDLGGAGFRGFQDERDPRGRVRNIQFASGGHGIGVDVADTAKLDAIVDYAVAGQEARLQVFRNTARPAGWLDVLSNVQWLVWLALAAFAIGLGWLSFRAHRLIGGAYVALLLLLLNSV